MIKGVVRICPQVFDMGVAGGPHTERMKNMQAQGLPSRHLSIEYPLDILHRGEELEELLAQGTSYDDTLIAEVKDWLCVATACLRLFLREIKTPRAKQFVSFLKTLRTLTALKIKIAQKIGQRVDETEQFPSFEKWNLKVSGLIIRWPFVRPRAIVDQVEVTPIESFPEALSMPNS